MDLISMIMSYALQLTLGRQLPRQNTRNATR
jgi:hypothetical protein